jgi:toxin ParE1/3/4
MSSRRLVPREQAFQDIEEITDYYLLEAGEATALAFIDALEKSVRLYR